MSAALPARGALVAVAVLLLLALAWQLGRQSVQRGFPGLPADAARAPSPAAVDGDDVDPLERIAAERDVALAAVDRLEGRLAELHRAADVDAAELALYRRIESGDGTQGLSIDSVEVVDAGADDASLAVTLIQSRGRHRVLGTVSTRLLDAGHADPAGGGDGGGVGVALGEAPFDLRFFETVRVPLDASARAMLEGAGRGAAGAPRVELDVRPSGERHDPFVAIVPIGPTVEPPTGE